MIKVANKIWQKLISFLARKAILEAHSVLNTSIKPKDKVLDLGCGSGIVGLTFGEIFNTSVVGYDLKDRRLVPINFVLGKGIKLPFKDKSFDVVLLFFILHHLDKHEQKKFLEEALRVSRKYVLVAEDTPENIFHWLSCKRHLKTYNILNKHVKTKGYMRTKQGWLNLFSKLKVKSIKSTPITIYNPRHITSRIFFEIENSKS